MEILKFSGVYKDYIWGGTQMKDKFGIKTDISPLAESWVLSCHEDGMSIIKGGKYDGMSLKEYIEKNKAALGTSCKTNELPILIKFIDAAQNLSVQVHPDDEMAKLWENSNGKTEMWYVVDKDQGAMITYGMKKDTTKEELSAAIQNGTVESLLNCVPSEKGDVFFVEAGTVHAIGSGNLIAEIQQNSNITYRLYDYGRLGKDGKPRELHIDKGVAAANTQKVMGRNVCNCSDETKMIGSCEYFQVKEVVLEDKERWFLADEKSYHCLVQTEGATVVKANEEMVKISAGETAFIPAGVGEYSVLGSGTVLLVRNVPQYFARVNESENCISAFVEDEYGVIYGKGAVEFSSAEDSIKDARSKAICLAAKNSGLEEKDISKIKFEM